MRAVRSSGTLMCLGSGAAFGTMAIFGKLAYGEGATVGTLLAVRFALAAAVFWALVLAGGAMPEVRALRGRDVAVGLALGACGYSLQAGCYFAALERIDASLLSLLLYTFPAIVAVAAVALGRERLSGRRGCLPDDRRGARRRAAAGRTNDRRLGMASQPRGRGERGRDQPLLRRPAARRAHGRLDPRDGRAARDGAI